MDSLNTKARPCGSLLDQPAAQVSIYKSAFGVADGLAEHPVGDPFAALKAPKCFQFIDLQRTLYLIDI